MTDDVMRLRWLVAGWTVDEAAQRLDVTARTVRRWDDRPPGWLPNYYRLAGGAAPAWAPAWRGWRIYPDRLTDPGGEVYTPGDVLALRYYRALAEEYRRERSGQRAGAGPALRLVGR